MDSPDLGARVKGFFLRLRFGRLEAQHGGTGYRMARIKGSIFCPSLIPYGSLVSACLGFPKVFQTLDGIILCKLITWQCFSPDRGS